MNTPVEFYFDPISPYGYLAATQIEDLAARHGREVDWRPLLLSVTVLQIMGLKPVPLTPLKSDYSREDKHRMAALLGVPLKEHGLGNVSPIKSLRAFVWLKAQDPTLAARFARHICTLHWAQGQDIADTAVIARAAREVGADDQALLGGLDSEAAKSGLRTAVDVAVGKGVFGVPSFIVDEQLIWGVDRLWMLEHWLRHGAWTSPT